MSRRAQVVSARERLAPGPAWMRWPAEAAATLAWAECDGCRATLATVVRPAETAGDVIDAALHTAGWDAAHDLCPACVAEEHEFSVMRGDPIGVCAVCARRCR